MLTTKEAEYEILFDVDANIPIYLIMRGDLDGLKYAYTHNYAITYIHYHDAVIKSNGECLEHLECVKFLEQIRVVYPHRLILDSALYGKLELMKYLHKNGEDLTHYKLLMQTFILTNNFNNPCREYILTYLRQNGMFANDKIIEMQQENLISIELTRKLLALPNGSFYKRLLNCLRNISVETILNLFNASIPNKPWNTVFDGTETIMEP